MKLTIKHSGNIGDIIYSLPAMNKTSQIHNKKVTVLLQTNVRAQYADHPNFNHPSGSVQLNHKGAEMLKPLLLSLPLWDYLLSPLLVLRPFPFLFGYSTA